MTRNITTSNASWIALDGSLFGINLFAYDHAVNMVAAVDAGYDQVRNGLVSLYGGPFDEQLSPHDNRAAVWLVRETEIELYAHISLAPTLQVGLSHKDRNPVYEHRVLQSADEQNP